MYDYYTAKEIEAAYYEGTKDAANLLLKKAEEILSNPDKTSISIQMANILKELATEISKIHR